MRTKIFAVLTAFVAGAVLNSAQAQEEGYFGGVQGGGADGQFLRQPFMLAIDTDGNGAISAEEIEGAIESLSVLDKNGNGDLDYLELSGGIENGPFVGWLRMLTAIRVIDRSGDSVISAEKLQNAPHHLKRLDRDGNWTLTANELDDSRRTRTQGGEPNENGEYVGGVVNNQGKVTNPIWPGEDDRQFEGYMLFKVTSIAADVQAHHTAYLLDPEGKIFHKWEGYEGHVPETASVHLLENGLLLRQQAPGDWLELLGTRVGSYGILQLVDWDGNVVWEYERCIVGQHCLHHDIEPMPNGNILVMAHVAFSRDEVMHWGANNSGPTVQFEQLLELKPNLEDGSTEIVWTWNSWDHIVQDVDPNKANYGIIHEEVGKHDINQRRITGERLHMNSVDYHLVRSLHERGREAAQRQQPDHQLSQHAHFRSDARG